MVQYYKLSLLVRRDPLKETGDKMAWEEIYLKLDSGKLEIESHYPHDLTEKIGHKLEILSEESAKKLLEDLAKSSGCVLVAINNQNSDFSDER